MRADLNKKVYDLVECYQYYELPYNPLNKMVDVIGTQESGTKVVGMAFDIQTFASKIINLTLEAIEEGLPEEPTSLPVENSPEIFDDTRVRAYEKGFLDCRKEVLSKIKELDQ